QAAVVGPVGPCWSGTDAFHPAGHIQRISTGANQTRSKCNGIQAGTTLPINREPGHRDGQAGLQRSEPRHVSTTTNSIAHDDVVQPCRLKPSRLTETTE